jgi:hypothetical protein
MSSGAERPARAYQEGNDTCRGSSDLGTYAIGGAVQIRHGPPLSVAGASEVYDAVWVLPRGSLKGPTARERRPDRITAGGRH